MAPSPVRSGRSRWIVIGALVVAVALAAAGWAAFAGKRHVPDASFTLLSGEKISTSTLRGKVYLVNFWATSCTTCVKEMPEMVKTYQQFHKDGLEFVAVAMNYDAPMYVANYAKTRELPFKVALDDGSAAHQFGDVQLTPTTFLVDRDGRILKRYVGEPEYAELHRLIEGALAKQA
ncbi:TlpA disulfide reductase family protein [Chitinasiproducens palmae]|uniref:Thiol-disulfide isomerase or thioredoxin n=1 Tax=Chitinasiproducens palmae TaxID=1770053 RepID=A0A1H2PPN0_9BURK|nr:TlpA disulfide reductase family protein [Chitinasiproducens palmae]SDV48266.1 Thiol-disulfide isomerase or thioredoxin [Chitinasiproducens palmae]